VDVHLNARNAITVDNQAYIFIAFVTQNDSLINSPKFGTLFAESALYAGVLTAPHSL
jgi:hypothetical protein